MTVVVFYATEVRGLHPTAMPQARTMGDKQFRGLKMALFVHAALYSIVVVEIENIETKSAPRTNGASHTTAMSEDKAVARSCRE